MKIKVKQNFYSVHEGRLVDVKEELDVKDEHGKDLIAAGYAEEFVSEQPKKLVKKQVKVVEE